MLELLEGGRALPPFEDYLEFSLTFEQLKDLFRSQEAHRDWRIPLSAVAGVYLIVAEKTGDLYVGSASGENGIWGRWQNYADSGDGGNAKLPELIKADSAYPERFRFPVLQTLPKTMTRTRVIRREVAYRHKLGNRAACLNG